MPSTIERIKIWGAVKLGWSVPGRMLEAIRGFQATEADGVWHLHRSYDSLSDPRHRSIVFTHSLEEESHADEFARVYKQSSNYGLSPIRYERRSLYGRDAPAWKSFAYVHVGEVDATDRFKAIRANLDDGPLRTALAKIVDDEEGHIDLTHDILLEMGAKPKEIQREMRRVRMARAWENWLRVGKRMADWVISLQLSIIYYLAGPFMFLFARRKLRNSVVEYDNNHLKRM